MRILFITPYLPSRIRVRPLELLRALARQGHQITLVALDSDDAADDEEARDLLAACCAAVHRVPFSRGAALLRAAGRLATPTPLWAAYCFSPPLERTLRQILQAQTFDVAHVEHLRAAHWVRVLRSEANRLPILYDAVDCIAGLQDQLRRAPERGLPARLISWMEWAKLQRYEPAMAAQCNRIIATSAPDAACLRRLGAAQGLDLAVEVVPNGVDLDYFRPALGAEGEIRPGRLVFSGKMSYAANHDAALYLCREIFPAVRRGAPGATLTLAGSGPLPALRALAARSDSGIEVTGRVPDLRPYLTQAALAVCPLRIGVGIQNKVLEAMAMGKAVLASPLACGPLEGAVREGGLCRADDTPAFVSQIVDLLRRPDEAARIGRQAQRWVEAHHDWRTLAGRLTLLYEDLVSGPKAPAFQDSAP